MSKICRLRRNHAYNLFTTTVSVPDKKGVSGQKPDTADYLIDMRK